MIEVVVGPSRVFFFAGTGFQSVCPPYVELVMMLVQGLCHPL